MTAREYSSKMIFSHQPVFRDRNIRQWNDEKGYDKQNGTGKRIVGNSRLHETGYKSQYATQWETIDTDLIFLGVTSLTCKMGLVISFSQGWQKAVVGQLWPLGQVQPTVKLYWNSARPICLRVVCGCVHTTRAELGCCDRDLMVPEDGNVYYLALYRKRSPTSVVRVPMKISKCNRCHAADAQYKLFPSCPLRKVILVTEGTRKCRFYFMTGLQGTRFIFTRLWGKQYFYKRTGLRIRRQ